MDALPTEMLELIFQQLSPRDLAHCSAVCRSWYEVINQDCMWVKHCDPELEEPLRTIPSVAPPTFDIPEAKTLSPPSEWKAAFLREKHLMKNWRAKKILQLEEENILKFEGIKPFEVDFFSDTQIIVWYSNKIEILDIRSTPPVIAAQTDISVSIEINPIDFRKVVGKDLLLVQKVHSIEVFRVDDINKCITSKYILSDNIRRIELLRIKGNFYIFSDRLPVLKILDLNTGKLLKADPFPVEVNQNERASLLFLYISPTSDFVYLSVIIRTAYDQKEMCKSFVYSLKRLAYLPGPVMTFEYCFQQVTLDNRWMVLLCSPDVLSRQQIWEISIFYISQKDEVLIHNRISQPTRISPDICVCNGWFVFVVDGANDNRLRAYSPSSKTLITIDENFKEKNFTIINNKVIAVFDRWGREYYAESTWKPSNQTVEKCDFPVVRGCKINRSFTTVVKRVSSECFSDLEVKKYGNCWYVKHLW